MKSENITTKLYNLKDQLINPETLIKLQFDEEDYISNVVYTKYSDNNTRLKITFWYDDDTILIEYYIEEDKLIFLFQMKEFTIGKLREVLKLCNLQCEL